MAFLAWMGTAHGQSSGSWTEVYRSGTGTLNEQIQAVQLGSIGRSGPNIIFYVSRNTLFGRDTEKTVYVSCSDKTRGEQIGQMYSTYPNTLAGSEVEAVCSRVQQQDDEKMRLYRQLSTERNGGTPPPAESEDTEQMKLYRRLAAERAERDAADARDAWRRQRERAAAADAESQRQRDNRAAPPDDDDSTGPSMQPGSRQPMFPPTGTDPSGPACATGQQELVDAQVACAAGNTQMCARSAQLKNALRSIHCAVPVLAGGQGSEANARGGSSQQQAGKKPPVDCVRPQRRPDGGVVLYNGCGFVVNYAFCVQDRSSSFACDASMNSQGADSIRPGQTTFAYKGNVVFAACEGGFASGNLARLEGGRAVCR